jgi:hypothetical protein
MPSARRHSATGACDREQVQQTGDTLGLATGQWQALGEVPPQSDRVVGEPPAGDGAQQDAAGGAQQAEPAGEVPEQQDGEGLVLPVVLADPVGVPAEAAHRLGDDRGRQVAGLGEPDSVPDPRQQPAVGLDGRRVGSCRPAGVQAGIVDEPEHRHRPGAAQLLDELGGLAGIHPGMVAGGRCHDGRRSTTAI